MSRSRRKRAAPADRLSVSQTPPATARDGHVVVKLADAATAAIVGTAAEYGLQWDRDSLYQFVSEIIARQLRASPEWWTGRAKDGSR
jgi:hypothetical protein